VVAGEDSDLEGDHEAAAGGLVNLVKLRRGGGGEVGRTVDGGWAVGGEDVGDVFAVEEVVDAEAELRLIEDGVAVAVGEVEEEVDVVIGRDVGLIVIGTVVV